jgi:hypothetical protein
VQIIAITLEDVVLLEPDFNVQIARGPPLVPGSPLPVLRMRMPPSMPAGILTSSVFCFLILPWPWQAVQGSGMTLPVPRQVGQVCCTLKKPWRICTEPEPLQVAQVLTWVPGLAPLPLQTVARVPAGDADLGVLAACRFFQRDFHGVAQVAATEHLAATAPARPPRCWPNMSPKMSPKASAKPP